MNPYQNMTAMKQKIFKMGLSVETVSAYLICCSLADTNTDISTNNLMQRWNSSESALVDSLNSLENRNILRRVISGADDTAVYELTDDNEWKRL